MTNSQRLATVRQRLIQWLADNTDIDGATDSQSKAKPIQSESILIRDEFYCGRRFNMGSHRAVWFIEEDELKVYDESGQLLEVISSQEIDEPSEKPDVIRMPTAEERTQQSSDDDGEIRRAA